MQTTHEMVVERRRSDQRSERLIEWTCFLVFLPVALLAGLSGWRWRPWPPGPQGYESVFAEARTKARIIAGMAVNI